jgi:hypothetical protein
MLLLLLWRRRRRVHGARKNNSEGGEGARLGDKPSGQRAVECRSETSRAERSRCRLAGWLAGRQADRQASRHDGGGGGGEGGGCVQTYHSAGTLVCQCSARSCEAQAQSLVVRGSGGSRAAG